MIFLCLGNENSVIKKNNIRCEIFHIIKKVDNNKSEDIIGKAFCIK